MDLLCAQLQLPHLGWSPPALHLAAGLSPDLSLGNATVLTKEPLPWTGRCSGTHEEGSETGGRWGEGLSPQQDARGVPRLAHIWPVPGSGGKGRAQTPRPSTYRASSSLIPLGLQILTEAEGIWELGKGYVSFPVGGSVWVLDKRTFWSL